MSRFAAAGVGLLLVLSLVPGCRNPSFESRLAAAEAAADRQAVIELINRYAFGLDRGDQIALRAIFLPDAIAEYVGVGNPLDVRLEGIDAILAWLRETDHGRSPPGHYMATHVVEVEGDEARLTAYQHNRDVSGAGLYTIDARRTPNGWRIARLHLDQHLLGSVSDPDARRRTSP
jgi:SnoaL-like domain